MDDMTMGIAALINIAVLVLVIIWMVRMVSACRRTAAALERLERLVATIGHNQISAATNAREDARAIADAVGTR